MKKVLFLFYFVAPHIARRFGRFKSAPLAVEAKPAGAHLADHHT
jgi:hypothetical protein